MPADVCLGVTYRTGEGMTTAIFRAIFYGPGAITILSSIAWITSKTAGRNYAFGMTGIWISIFNTFISKQPLRWNGYEIIGITLGALIASIMAKEFKLRMPKNLKMHLQIMVECIMM